MTVRSLRNVDPVDSKQPNVEKVKEDCAISEEACSGDVNNTIVIANEKHSEDEGRSKIISTPKAGHETDEISNEDENLNQESSDEEWQPDFESRETFSSTELHPGPTESVTGSDDEFQQDL